MTVPKSGPRLVLELVFGFVQVSALALVVGLALVLDDWSACLSDLEWVLKLVLLSACLLEWEMGEATGHWTVRRWCRQLVFAWERYWVHTTVVAPLFRMWAQRWVRVYTAMMVAG